MRACYRCKGGGKIFKKGRFTAEDKFWGRNQETCPVCYGSGKDPNWYTLNCQAPGCWREFEVNRRWKNVSHYCETHRGEQHKSCKGCNRQVKFRYTWNNIPEYCESCRNNWQEKRCASNGCKNTVRYKRAWDNIPSYCGWCQKNIQQGASDRQCEDCGTLIWVPHGKNFTRCRDCNEKQRAKWKTKPCAGGCGNTIKYHEDWDHPPNFCKSCKEKGTAHRHESNQSENPRFNAACGRRGANLNPQEKDGFRAYFHTIPDRQRMSFDEIVSLAQEWKRNNGGGFRRSDRPRR